MNLTHEYAGLFISFLGVLFILMANPLPRQAQRWHVHAIEQVEPAMLAWIVRGVGGVLFILGLVTMMNAG